MRSLTFRGQELTGAAPEVAELPALEPKLEVARLRQVLLDKGSALLALLALSLIVLWVLVPGDARSVPTWESLAILALIAACAAWRSGPFNLRAGLLVFALFAGELVCLLRLGYVVDTTVLAMSTFVVTGLLFGARWAIAAWATSALLLVAGFGLIESGAVAPMFDPTNVDPKNVRTGVRFALIYGGVSGTVALGVWFMASRLSSSLNETHAALADVVSADLDRKHAEAERVRSEERWAAVAANSPDIIFNVDRNHRIEFINRTPKGVELDAILGRTAEEFVAETHVEATRDAIDHVFDSGLNTEYDAPERDERNGERWFTSRLAPITENGEVRSVTITASDVTERRNLEAQLRQSQKLEAVGQLTGGVAHDFNNLLTVVLGDLELATEDLGADHPTVQLLASATEAAERGAALTQRLLAFSRKQALRPRSVDLTELLGGMRDLLSRTIGATVDVDIDSSDVLWPCEVDPVQLESTILNLAINARDAMPGGGKLKIETANVTLDAAFVAGHDDVAAGDYVMLAASDTGTGMAPEVVQMAFDPFFTTKDVGRGTGLGLSSVYGFVRQSRGHISIDSEEGKGTTVRFYLPRSVEQPSGVEGPEAIKGEPRGNGELILVVEDDPNVRAMSVKLLRSLGYRTVDACDAVVALSALDEFPDIAMLFTDVVLPGSASGADLVRITRRRLPELAVLLTSGYTGDAIIHYSRLGPETQLIEKPFSRAALAQQVRAALLAKHPPAD